MQRARRHDPYPVAWEIPVGILVAVLLLLVLGVHAGRAVATFAAAGWWGFPDRADLFTSLPGLLSGDAGAGLDTRGRPVASGALLWGCIAAVEALVLALIVLAVKGGLTRWGPSRTRGLATRDEAERLLGPARLRRHARIVRPDLYGRNRSRS